MAFEVFDDVAFYWFLLAAFSAWVFPITHSFWSVLPRRPRENWTRGMSSCKVKNARVDSEHRKATMAKVFGWRGIGFIVGWVGLITLSLKLTLMQQEEMYSFNPYKILNVEEGTEMSAIKKSYRRLSLQFHVRCRRERAQPRRRGIFVSGGAS